MTQSLPKPKDSTQEPAPSPQEQQNRSQSRKSRLRFLIPIGLLFTGIGAAAWYFLSRPEPEGLELSGRLEGYPTDLDSEVSGRITSITVREGDRVEQGEIIARLDEAELQAQLKGATARISAAQQRERQARLELNVIESQIEQAQLNRQQATVDAQGRILQAEANVAAAEAQLAQAQAQLTETQSELALAQSDRERYAFLVQEGAVTQQRFDQAQTNSETAQANVNNQEAAVAAARRQVKAAQGALVEARSTGFNPEIRSAQEQEIRRQLAVAQAELAAAQAEVEDAQANRQETLAQLDDLDIVSPIDGVVITRPVEPGTVVTNGATLLTVLDPNSVYLRGFIPEGDIGWVRVGQKAQVYLDSFPERPLEAYVKAVDTEASFTPENIYFKEDRVQQVFGVDIKIVAPEGFAKPGMPADAIILPEEPNP